MGHERNYTLGDLVARYKRANVSMFYILLADLGLPAENAAISNNVHPKTWQRKIFKIWKLN